MSNVLITGGSGFLGRGLMKYWPDNNYVVLSRDEYKQDLCRRQYPDTRFVLGDVKDYDRLVGVMRTYAVDTVIHTAALKFIPEAEYNVDECIEVNVEGSRNVLAAAMYCEVQSVVGISTDKAVLPINTYGMTKALMERLFQERATNDLESHYGLVRYGNVIGSTGSVIPLFKDQLVKTGKITITDPDMTRYWISIQQAVELVKLALEHNSGSIIIPKPRSMSLLNVAEAVCGGTSKIEITGPRAGEKRHEQLLHQQESVRARDLGPYYELLKVGSANISEPFILSSNTPEAGWFELDEFRDLIKEASCI